MTLRELDQKYGGLGVGLGAVAVGAESPTTEDLLRWADRMLLIVIYKQLALLVGWKNAELRAAGAPTLIERYLAGEL